MDRYQNKVYICQYIITHVSLVNGFLCTSFSNTLICTETLLIKSYCDMIHTYFRYVFYQ